MPGELIADQYGQTMELIPLPSGRLLAPDMVEETCLELPNLPLNQDDVMLCSYPKSGCHWLWQVLRYLRFGDVDHLDKVDKEGYMIELNSVQDLATLNSPRILNNHLLFEDQPMDLVKKKVKVVFIYRNPKDTAVSFYFHHMRFKEYKYQDTFPHYLRRLVSGLVDSGNMFTYLRSWEAGLLDTPGLSAHVLSYEDMKEEPVRELERLSKFLGTRSDKEFLQKVSEATTFHKMQTHQATVTDYLDEEGRPVMYRKGQVGDWKNYFTVADSEWLDQLIQKELGQSQLFKFRYEI